MPAAHRALIYDDFEIKKNEKQNLKTFLCGTTNRKLFSLWVTTLVLLFILIVIGITGKYYIADEISFVLSTFLGKPLILLTLAVAGAVITTVLVRYASRDNFPTSAFVLIGLTLLSSFAMIGLLAEDLSFTLKNKADLLEQD